MGCIEAKNSSEETSILEAERVLNFHKQKSYKVDSIIRKFSLNGKVNSVQLSRIADHLNLQIYNTPPFMRIQDFYDKLKDTSGNYDIKDLLIIGILLSDGEPCTKAALLYQVFDEELTGHMDSMKVRRQLLEKVATYSCSTLPRLVSPEQSPTVNVIKNDKYIKDMMDIKDTCIASICERLCTNGPDITEITFTEVFRTFQHGLLTSSSGWRTFLTETFIREAPKKLVFSSKIP